MEEVTTHENGKLRALGYLMSVWFLSHFPSQSNSRKQAVYSIIHTMEAHKIITTNTTLTMVTLDDNRRAGCIIPFLSFNGTRKMKNGERR